MSDNQPEELQIEELIPVLPKKGKYILDGEKRREICAILAVGGTRTTAALYVGCHPATIRRTAKRDPEFAEQLCQAASRHEIFHLRNINAAAGDLRHWRAAAWALEHMYPDRYARKAGVINHEQLKLVLNKFAGALLQDIVDDEQRAQIQARLKRIVFSLEASAAGEA